MGMSHPPPRVLVSLAIILACAAFQFAPGFLALGPVGQQWWSVTWWVVVPGLAAVTCAIASKRSTGQDRKAWREFCIGSGLWAAGTLVWALFDLRRGAPAFPGFSDAAYLLTALFFVTGMFRLGLQDRLLTRIHAANLALVLCSVAISCFLLLLPILRDSNLAGLGQVVAVLYPILWFGTVAFGLIFLTIYAPVEKRLMLTLLLLGALVMAAANLFYCLSLMGASYQIGVFFDSFWVLCFLLVGWAALEQSRQSRLGVRVFSTGETTPSQRLAEAFVPSGAVAVACLAALEPGVSMWGSTFLWFLPPAMLFAAFLGLREHWALCNERQLKDAEIKSRMELASVLESTTDNVIVINRDWRLTYINGRARELFRSLPEFQIGADLRDVFPEEVGGAFERQYQAAFDTGRAIEFEESLSNGSIWFEVHAYPGPDGLSVFFRDVTERRQTRERLEFLAHHDTLTGLKNRRVFHDEIEKALRTECPNFAAICLDLDHFKDVNDTMGHPTGDALLVEIAARLRSCVREGDVVARVGGDEFAILQRQITSRRDVEDLADRILTAAKAAIPVNGQMVHIGCSIGIAIPDHQSRDSDELLKTADIALYSAKAQGRGSYRFFEPEMAEKLKDRQSLKIDLSTALSNSELELVYQPIVDLATNRVGGFEALLRWRHPERGMVSPVNFIPIAEETGLIVPIGEWALEQACREAARWPGDISVAVNLSTSEFRSRNLPERVRDTLRAAGLPPGRLELEITESVLLQDSDANLETLQRLRETGVKIALDDFGTGYSSLSYLRTFPFDKIKIDRSFVARVEEESESQNIIRAVVSLGRSLGMAITAEGVETRQQLDRIRAKGCNQVQGYFFSKPVPPAAIPALVAKIEADRIWWAGTASRQVSN